MTTRSKTADERALATIHAIYGTPDDVDPAPPVDPQIIARMRAAIDDAFDRAWKAARERAKAEHASHDRRDGYLALARDALVARINAWQDRLGPSLQLAHRQLADMTDDDLRTLLSDIEELAARKGIVP